MLIQSCCVFRLVVQYRMTVQGVLLLWGTRCHYVWNWKFEWAKWFVCFVCVHVRACFHGCAHVWGVSEVCKNASHKNKKKSHKTMSANEWFLNFTDRLHSTINNVTMRYFTYNWHNTLTVRNKCLKYFVIVFIGMPLFLMDNTCFFKGICVILLVLLWNAWTY